MSEMFRFFSVLVFSLLLAACGKGLDKKPDFSSYENYKPRIDSDFSEATPAEVEAFNFAVSNIDFGRLKEKYAGKSYRSIAKDELIEYLSSMNKQLAAAKGLKPELDKKMVEIAKVKIEVMGSELTHDKFFDKRDLEYSFRISNGSTLSLSKVQLNAILRINGRADAIYEWNPIIQFDNGLRPGESASYKSSMVGFLSFDKPITLEVREAKSRDVILAATDLADFSESWLIGKDSALSLLNSLPGQIKETEQHLNNL